MKKSNYLISILLICLSLVLFTSCEKEETPTVEDSQTVDPSQVDDDDSGDDTGDDTALSLCLGDESTNPLPLKVGNRWYLKKKQGGWNEEIKVTQKVIKNNVEYFQVNQKFLRVDSNGDIYELEEFSNGDSEEYMIVPRNPTNGQEWDYHGLFESETFIRKIRLVSVSEDSFLALDLEGCTLTNYIIVDEVKIEGNGTQTIVTSTFYAPGVGYIGDGTYNLLSELELN